VENSENENVLGKFLSWIGFKGLLFSSDVSETCLVELHMAGYFSVEVYLLLNCFLLIHKNKM